MTRAITEIAVHCSATPPHMDIGVKEIREWHKRRGWRDIGYHGVIRRDGTREYGRPFDQIGAHVKGHNKDSLGICMIGGVNQRLKPENNFTPAQFYELRKWINELKTEYPIEVVQGHRDYPNVSKACPSFDVRAWYAPPEVFTNPKPSTIWERLQNWWFKLGEK